ncbi:MAG: hypothetical protein Q4A34_03540 [Candidatus Saccharibacteria bacterium]|nr:hypothetical protein [Candidatus Saccharibacteria bacterium]
MISLTDLTQKQWARAFEKLGAEIDTRKGKGSHIRAFHPSGNFKPQTIPYKVHKFISIELYKTLLEWGFSEEDIDKALK